MKNKLIFSCTIIFLSSMLFMFAAWYPVYAAGSEGVAESHVNPLIFLWIAVILLAAKLVSLVERFGQPSVLGELFIGIVLGNLGLLGISFFEPIRESAVIAFLAEFGVIILLFQIGLESNIEKMKRVGMRAFLVALVGVVVPFVLGVYMVGPWLLPTLSFYGHLFVGAALTATSVGITGRIFRDLKRIQDLEAQIVLEAAVIDDILGLIILAIVSAMVTVGTASVQSIGLIVLQAFVFLIGAIVVGHLVAPLLGKVFSRINTGVGMKFTLALSIGLLFAFVAGKIGLAPIVGAFAAGLILDPVHFRFFKDPDIVNELKESVKKVEPAIKNRISKVISHHSDRHIEELIDPLAHFFVPIFFVTTGMAVRFDTLFSVPVILGALGITAIAIIGKMSTALVAGKVRKSIVGWGMVPRGEVGLIFATIGISLGVISDQVFSMLVIMVLLTTFIAPVALTILLKRNSS